MFQANTPARDWLIQNLRVYLSGFWNHRIGPKTRKDSQKAAGRKYEDPPLTKGALTMVGPYAKWMLL
jgi:hypothetical protein